ncbi:unnamed protein product [Lactuca virosa]|uniref:RRM domain-containing protein n=1 Tax=Lactuca virosa TaxID=75947 RepID=A0AAU9P9I3_9ASTR|nr:unnamed protein product [Lactuca virosa]
MSTQEGGSGFNGKMNTELLEIQPQEIKFIYVFEQHGELIEVKVICDHKSGKSKGYGFVHFVSEESATKALAEMHGQLLDGRNIQINYANKK